MYYECQTLSAGKKHDFNDEIWLYFSTFFDQIIRKFVPMYLHEFAFNYVLTIFFTHLRHDLYEVKEECLRQFSNKKNLQKA